MGLSGLFLLALALSADSFAAAIAKGIRINRARLSYAIGIGLLFGTTQAAMPLVGWGVGREIQPLIEAYDHWVAFAILAFIGGKMIVEALRGEAGEDDEGPGGLRPAALFLVAIATSLDALAVGFGFGFLEVPIALAVAVIGAVTFAAAFTGVYMGRAIGERWGHYVEIAGGGILIAIGARILIEHLSA